ncbi:SMR family transporter [Thiomicrorhabdus hydrogeniphila]
MVYFYLALAVVFEVIATSFLKLSEGFTNLWPSVIVVVGYSLAFFFLSQTLKHLPLGLTYALWAGLGVIVLNIVGIVLFKQVPDTAAWLGMGLIMAGVIVIQIFSKTSSH